MEKNLKTLITKIFIILAIIMAGNIYCFQSIAQAETYPTAIYTANQISIKWDDMNTNPDHVIGFNVFYKKVNLTTGEFGPETYVVTTQNNTHTFTFTEQGFYIFGVQAEIVSIKEALKTIIPESGRKSAIAWSNNPINCFEQKTFGTVYINLTFPTNMQLSE